MFSIASRATYICRAAIARSRAFVSSDEFAVSLASVSAWCENPAICSSLLTRSAARNLFVWSVADDARAACAASVDASNEVVMTSVLPGSRVRAAICGLMGPRRGPRSRSQVHYF
jgi:hypothetical protein